MAFTEEITKLQSTKPSSDRICRLSVCTWIFPASYVELPRPGFFLHHSAAQRWRVTNPKISNRPDAAPVPSCLLSQKAGQGASVQQIIHSYAPIQQQEHAPFRDIKGQMFHHKKSAAQWRLTTSAAHPCSVDWQQACAHQPQRLPCPSSPPTPAGGGQACLSEAGSFWNARRGPQTQVPTKQRGIWYFLFPCLALTAILFPCLFICVSVCSGNAKTVS